MIDVEACTQQLVQKELGKCPGVFFHSFVCSTNRMNVCLSVCRGERQKSAEYGASLCAKEDYNLGEFKCMCLEVEELEYFYRMENFISHT